MKLCFQIIIKIEYFIPGRFSKDFQMVKKKNTSFYLRNYFKNKYFVLNEYGSWDIRKQENLEKVIFLIKKNLF